MIKLGNRVCVFGGAGFVGRAVATALSQAGYEVTLLLRRPERYRDLALLKQVKLRTFNDWKAEALVKLFQQHDIIVNLMADQSNPSETLLDRELVAKTQMIKHAAERAGIKRLIQLSQVGANANQAKSDWLRILGEADAIVHNMVAAHTTILRAGLLVGEGDDTTRLYKQQLQTGPLLMVPNADKNVQPLWVKDFARALVGCIKHEQTFEKKYEVVGAERMALIDLAVWVKQLMGLEQAMVLPMCQLNAKFMLLLGGLAPFKTVSAYQQKLLAQDLVSEQDFASHFGFAPTPIETLLATYIVPNRLRYRYDFFRSQAGRDLDELR
ncbi:MAG: NAD(P)H-binding protein [Thiomicrospira sp.]|jgi:NADH dehydrogenase|nr:NAD(P)H-binding protein [Thiomicrospira sp.]